MSTFDDRELRRKLIAGTKWAAGLRFLTQVTTWLVTIFVVRYLTPDDYGLNAMLEVPIELFMLFSAIGIDMALIQKKQNSDAELAEAFGLLLLVNGVFFLALLLIAPLVAAYFREPRLELLIQVTSVVFLISPFRTIPNALLDRELAFELKSKVEFAAMVIASFLSLALAIAGAGVWALVAAVLVSAVLRAVFLALLRPWVIRPHFRFASIGGLVRYGGIITLSGAMWVIATKSVYVIAGPTIGGEALGLLAVAGEFAMLPLSKIMPIVQQALYPAFALIQGQPTLAKSYLLKSIELTALLIFPLSIGMVCVAERFVPVLFGDHWTPMVLPLMLWASVTPIRMICNLYVPALNGCGHARQVLLINCALFVMLVSGALYARDHGLIGLALLWVVVTPLYLLVTLYLSRKAFPVSVSELLRAVWPASLAVCAMVVAIMAFEAFIPGATTLLRLVLDVLLGALVYGGVLLLAFPQRVAVIRQQLFGQRGNAA
jgi:O-antigen/teichoic acid export membrane protein